MYALRSRWKSDELMWWPMVSAVDTTSSISAGPSAWLANKGSKLRATLQTCTGEGHPQLIGSGASSVCGGFDLDVIPGHRGRKPFQQPLDDPEASSSSSPNEELVDVQQTSEEDMARMRRQRSKAGNRASPTQVKTRRWLRMRKRLIPPRSGRRKVGAGVSPTRVRMRRWLQKRVRPLSTRG
ncbi:MAG: hypothetical protein SGPRY_002669 [Prymnesium sp.]